MEQRHHPTPPEPTDLEELDQVEAAARGDRVAFEWLYHRYVRKIYNLCFRLLQNPLEAEEACQEVFYQAYRNLPKFEGRSRFYTWIFRIATNVALQHRAKLHRTREHGSLERMEEQGLPAPTGNLDPVREVQEREFLEQLNVAMAKLPENHRVVMALGPLQGHSYEEIAQILGLSVEVVKGRLHRAREKIRELLRDYRQKKDVT